MTRPLRKFVFQMNSVHVWQYEIEAHSFAEAVRMVVDGSNESYDQDEVTAHVQPSTAVLCVDSLVDEA